MVKQNVARVQLNALFKVIALIVFFVTFFSNYLIFGSDIVESFIRGIISLILGVIIAKTVYFLWRFAFSTEEWKRIVEGPQEILIEDETQEEK